MHCSTAQELAEWLAKSGNGISLDGSGDGSLFFKGGDAYAVEFPWPATPLKITYWAWVAATVDYGEEEPFYGATLWVSLSTIGSMDKSGWHMVERMRVSFGEHRQLQIAPVHYFRDDEVVDAMAFLVPCFVYQWNAFYLNSFHDTFAHISHDEYWCIVTRDKEKRDRLLKIEGAKLEPRLLERFLRQ